MRAWLTLLVASVALQVLASTAVFMAEPLALPAVPPAPVQDKEPELEAYPGQNNHAEPPAGWVCEHQNFQLSVPAAHVCSCERGCDETGVLHEDKKCAVYCHADHCHCEIAHKDLCPK